MKKLIEVVVLRDIDEKQRIYSVIDVYHENNHFTAQLTSEKYTIPVLDNKNLEEFLNHFLIKNKKDLNKKEIDYKRILKEFDLFEEIKIIKSKEKKDKNKLVFRLGKIFDKKYESPNI